MLKGCAIWVGRQVEEGTPRDDDVRDRAQGERLRWQDVR